MSPKTPCYVPLQTGVPQHSHCVTQSWAVEPLCCHVPFQSLRTSASSLSYCHRSGCHNCLRANSPVCLQTPSPCTQVPCWPVTWEGDSCVPSWVQETACSFSGSPPATTSPMPGATLRGWNTWQEHHTATTALAPVPLLCFAAAFPK